MDLIFDLSVNNADKSKWVSAVDVRNHDQLLKTFNLQNSFKPVC